MTRLPVLLALLLAAPSAVADECPWIEPKSPPKLTVDDGVASFEWPLDRAWWTCAKKAGGTQTVTFLLGGKDGPLTPFKESKRSGATSRESIWRSGFCEVKPLPHRVQVKVTGTGAMSKATFESPVEKIHCDRCEYRSYEGHFAIHVKSRLTPEGFITADGSYGEAFQKCAAEDADGTLELRVFVGKSEAEARNRTDHTFAIGGLEKSAKFKKAFPQKELCAEGATWVGIEYFGTGEFAQLNGSGRSAVETKCP